MQKMHVHDITYVPLLPAAKTILDSITEFESNPSIS